jgi:hypothetical protein
MNYAAWVELTKPWFVVLLFDPATRRIGIKPAKPGTPNTFRIRTHRPGIGRFVYAARLLKQFGIEVPRTVRFRDPRLTAGVVILDLNTAFVPGKAVRHRRRKSQTERKR